MLQYAATPKLLVYDIIMIVKEETVFEFEVKESSLLYILYINTVVEKSPAANSSINDSTQDPY